EGVLVKTRRAELEHHVDIVVVAGSIPAAPTISARPERGEQVLSAEDGWLVHLPIGGAPGTGRHRNPWNQLDFCEFGEIGSCPAGDLNRSSGSSDHQGTRRDETRVLSPQPSAMAIRSNDFSRVGTNDGTPNSRALLPSV